MQFYMPMHYLIYFILFFGAAFLIWRLSNKRGAKQRGNKARRSGASQSNYQGPRRRISDSRHLNRHERQILSKAESLIKKGDYISGAAHFESIGYIREAVSTLEENGHISEAAKVLMRLGINDRAGVIFMRNNMYQEAANCFRLAGMSLEQARCLRHSGQFTLAGDEFVKAGRFSEAAESFYKAKDYLSGAFYYHMDKDFDLAAECLKHLGNHSKTNINLTKEFLDFLVEMSCTHTLGKFVIQLLEKNNRMISAVKKLLETHQLERIKIYFTMIDEKIFAKIISELSLSPEQSQVLSSLFMDLNRFLEAGMILQRLNLFEEAAGAFEKANDFERSIYCYERAGKYERAAKLRREEKKFGEMHDDHANNSENENPKERVVSQIALHLEDETSADNSREESRLFVTDRASEKPSSKFPIIRTSDKVAEPSLDKGAAIDTHDLDQRLFKLPIFNQLSPRDRDLLLPIGTWYSSMEKNETLCIPELGLFWLIEGQGQLNFGATTFLMNKDNNFYNHNFLVGDTVEAIDFNIKPNTVIYYLMRNRLIPFFAKEPAIAGKVMMQIMQYGVSQSQNHQAAAPKKVS